jgi:putative hydrolase of the HAD superfamily
MPLDSTFSSLKIQAVLFDFGGTLDGDGVNWLDRFYALYAATDLSLPRDRIRYAFDFAEAQALRDPAMRFARLDEMLQRHVRLQFSDFGIENAAVENQIVSNFAAAVRAAAARNESLLAKLNRAGFRLGVISNGCGNTASLCDDLGFAKHLALVLDSHCIGVSKPDPQFFRYAADQLAIAPARVLMVGDSLGRDIRPAKQIGMRTVWLSQEATADPAADFHISQLAELHDLIPRNEPEP